VIKLVYLQHGNLVTKRQTLISSDKNSIGQRLVCEIASGTYAIIEAALSYVFVGEKSSQGARYIRLSHSPDGDELKAIFILLEEKTAVDETLQTFRAICR